MEQEGVIYKKRRRGYCTSGRAKEKILDERRLEFMGTRLPEMCRQMRMLGIGLEEVEKAWNE